MGVVYSAYDDRLGRPLAIKMIKAAVAQADARDRLWREARAAAKVNHRAICQLYEICEEDGELFLAMELLQGESLATTISRRICRAAQARGDTPSSGSHQLPHRRRRSRPRHPAPCVVH